MKRICSVAVDVHSHMLSHMRCSQQKPEKEVMSLLAIKQGRKAVASLTLVSCL